MVEDSFRGGVEARATLLEPVDTQRSLPALAAFRLSKRHISLRELKNVLRIARNAECQQALAT